MVETTFADFRVDQEGKANFLENVVGERENPLGGHGPF